MSVVQRVKAVLSGTESTPPTYECLDCGRTFEVDAPPERAHCMNCDTGDVERVEG